MAELAAGTPLVLRRDGEADRPRTEAQRRKTLRSASTLHWSCSVPERGPQEFLERRPMLALRSQIWSDSQEVVPSWSKSVQHWPTSAQIGSGPAKFCRFDPIRLTPGQNSFQIGLRCTSIGRELRSRLNSASWGVQAFKQVPVGEIRPNLADFGQSRTDFGQNWHHCAQLVQLLSDVGHFGLIFVEIRGVSQFGPELGPDWPFCCPNRAKAGRHCPDSAEFDRIWPAIDNIRPISTRFGINQIWSTNWNRPKRPRVARIAPMSLERESGSELAYFYRHRVPFEDSLRKVCCRFPAGPIQQFRASGRRRLNFNRSRFLPGPGEANFDR